MAFSAASPDARIVAVGLLGQVAVSMPCGREGGPPVMVMTGRELVFWGGVRDLPIRTRTSHVLGEAEAPLRLKGGVGGVCLVL